MSKIGIGLVMLLLIVHCNDNINVLGVNVEDLDLSWKLIYLDLLALLYSVENSCKITLC